MLFLSSNSTNKKVEFNLEETQMLISFYANNPALCDHKYTDCRDRNLRKAFYTRIWTIFDKISFVDLNPDVDESLTTLGVAKPQKKLKATEDVKVETQKVIASSPEFSPEALPSNDDNGAFPAHAPILVERASLTGKLVADNLL